MTDDVPQPSAEQVAAAGRGKGTHAGEPPAGGVGRLNWLRAGVLGADDGIVSVAGIVIGVAGATGSRGVIFTAGLASPVQAAAASALSFTLGALLPLLAILLPPATWRVPVTFVAVLMALALTGTVSARIGGSSPRRAVIRVVIGGAAGLALTYGIGHLFGTAIH
jgi:VIT1/CCC1 family predicted Fe2+/Mn2+ transporter